MVKFKQKSGSRFIVDTTGDQIPSEGSANVKGLFIAQSEYSDYSVSGLYSKSSEVTYHTFTVNSSGAFELPSGFFSSRTPMMLSFSLTKGSEIIVLNPIVVDIKRGWSSESILPEDTTTWQDVVESYIDTLSIGGVQTGPLTELFTVTVTEAKNDVDIKVSDYPALANYNTFYIILNKTENTASPWVQVLVNNIKVLQAPGCAMGVKYFKFTIHDGVVVNTSSANNINTSLLQDVKNLEYGGSIFPMSKRVGALTKITLHSYTTNWIIPGSEIIVYGGNE